MKVDVNVATSQKLIDDWYCVAGDGERVMPRIAVIYENRRGTTHEGGDMVAKQRRWCSKL